MGNQEAQNFPDNGALSAPEESHQEIVKLNRQIDEQTRYFDAILSSISDFAYTFDKDGRFVFVNQALLDLWGLRLEDALGKNFFDLQYPDDLAARLQRQIQEVYDTHRRVTDETPYTSPTGIVGYYEYIFSPFFGENGEVELVVGTTRNITERKQSEEKIKQLSARNLEILESFTDGFFSIDEEWRFIYVNQQAEQILDREPGDLLGKVMWDVYPGLIGSEFEKVYRQTAAERIPSTLISFYPDHERWYEVNAYPATNGITIYFRNATERIRTEETLRQSRSEAERQRRLYDTILSNVPDLVYVFDPDHRFTYANEALLTMWGKTWDEAIGKNCLELGYEPWHAEMHDREIEQVIATKQLIRGEVPFNSTFGRRMYDYIFFPIIGADGEVEAVAGTTRDITERNEMEDALREADRRKDEFLATLAHELRNPLAPIRSGLEVIRHISDDKTKFDETLDIIERQTNQIVHLVDDLLDISRITQGKINLRRERIELKTAIEMALETSQSLIDNAENELTVTLPYKPIYIDADLTRVAQIFLNILNNAAKYSDAGGRISLTAKKEDGAAVVSIKDSGLGIEPEMLSKIFEMFGQIETPEKQAHGGLGIGLSVVKKLVEMHGGSIQAFSEGRGKGSEFVVCLPLAAEQSETMPASEPSETDILQTAQMEMPENTEHNDDFESQKKPRRILVVDDNQDAVEMMETLLGFEGYTTRTAFEGETAIKIAADFLPEICLCDIGLPGMNGYELATRLRELLPQSLLISVSGWGQEEDRQRSIKAGFDYHLVKPVQFEDLLKLIEIQRAE
jgi:PAS domain S-box-containing protein